MFASWSFARFRTGRLPLLLIASLSAATPLLARAENGEALSAMLDRVVVADKRVATVGFRINAANRDRCSRPGFAPGLVLHAADQYPIPVRSDAIRHFGLGRQVGVAAVVEGSPSDRAGLRPGDAIVEIGGHPAPMVDIEWRGVRYDSVAAALNLIDSTAVTGTMLSVQVRRQGNVRTLTMTVDAGCAIRVQLVPSDEINAFSDDRYATITTGLERFAATDEALALLLGHELAHAYLLHERALDEASPLRSIMGRALLPSSVILGTEREADRLGMMLAARAGYDMSTAPAVWRTLDTQGGQTRFSTTHPGTAERILEADRQLDAMRQKRAAAPSR